jgi:hypothetical protein
VKKDNHLYLSKSFPFLLVKREMVEAFLLENFIFLLRKKPFLLESFLRVKKQNDPYLSKSFPFLFVKGEMVEAFLLENFIFLLRKNHFC